MIKPVNQRKLLLFFVFCFLSHVRFVFCFLYLSLFCVFIRNETCLELGDKGLHFILVNVALSGFCSVLPDALGPHPQIQAQYYLSCNILSHTIKKKILIFFGGGKIFRFVFCASCQIFN